MAQTANPETIMTSNFLIILGLIAASAFFTASEIAFAASRKLKLQQLAEDGHQGAKKILELKNHPGHFLRSSPLA